MASRLKVRLLRASGEFRDLLLITSSLSRIRLNATLGLGDLGAEPLHLFGEASLVAVQLDAILLTPNDKVPKDLDLFIERGDVGGEPSNCCC